MAELRRDPLSGNWMIVGYEQKKGGTPGVCPFCPGNEALTPPAIREYKDQNNNWLIRCVPASNPVFVIEGQENRRAEGFYDKMSNVGAHEIIIENRAHTKTMSMYTEIEFLLLSDMYRDRIADLKRDRRFKFIQLFKNHGELAGSYIFHPHSHVLATPIMPARVKVETENSRAHYRNKERCLSCDIIAQEVRQGSRVVNINRSFVAVCPFASRFPYETWIFPRAHQPFFEETVDETVKHEFAAITLDIMKRIEQVANAYTIEIHTSPEPSNSAGASDQDEHEYSHWHLEVLPRDFRSSKYKRENELHVISITPEQAATTLKTHG